MNRTVFKAAASTLIVAMTMTGATAYSQGMRPSRATGQADRQAQQLFTQAQRSLRQGELEAARGAMEDAVALSPRDVGYRLLLADIYLRAGRFESARATYADVIELDPSNIRAGLTFALTQIALGRPASAVARLDALPSNASAADVGLAYALAGQPERAIEMLDHAARSPSATPRIRQNLALAHALAGNWARARAIAAQDLSPADVGPRLEQWAAFARPGTAPTQVASLLGVSPAQDPGQPTRLALNSNRAPAAEAYAEAVLPPTPVYEQPVHVAPAPAAAQAYEQPAAPVEVAAAEPEAVPQEAPAFWVPTAQSYQTADTFEPVAQAVAAASDEEAAPPEAPAISYREQVRYAAAARTFSEPEPELIRASASAVRLPVPTFQRARASAGASVPVTTNGESRAVVQIGAFSNDANAERAWQIYSREYGLGNRRPLTTTIEMGGRTLHRVSVAGFADAGQAHALCGAIRDEGGACFVRGQAGDASIRWAARYAPGGERNA